MKLSYVIVTRNRKETLLRTLERLEPATHLARHLWEVFVVDNGSDDGTAGAVLAQFPDVRIVRLEENEGVPARNHALKLAQGRFIAFLDDDSYPIGDAIPRALAYLGRHSRTAAVVGRVILPDGSYEAPALPSVTLGGASVIRKSTLDELGGFAPEFFRQAEEYEMSFRIWQAGYRVERFEDVLFGHDKVPGGRCSALTRRMDLRNNLILAERFLPRELRRAYRRDWIRRYAAYGLHEGHAQAINGALREARVWARHEASVGRQTLRASALETIFGFEEQMHAVSAWRVAHKIRSVAIADFGKNIFATYRACHRSALEVVALLDNCPAFSGARYRSIPILPDAQLFRSDVEGIVVSNINPAQVDKRVAELSARFKLPVLRLWHPRHLESANDNRRPTGQAA